jgi:hypothetical protein
LAGFPRIIVWAWERPEDLARLDARDVGVAYLAKTLTLDRDRVLVRPRRQPLTVPPGATVIPVVRIEAGAPGTASLGAEQRDRVAAEIVGLAQLPGVAALQVDFDARVSERPFYRGVLAAVRLRAPADVKLSITALASWCLYDDWISDLPIDEAVPMLFRLGRDGEAVRSCLRSGGDFRAAHAGFSLGISTDEPLPKLPPGRRVYLFHPRAWSDDALHRSIAEVRSWQ